MNRGPPHATGGYSAPRRGQSSRSAGHRNPHITGGDGAFSDDSIYNRGGLARGGRGSAHYQSSPASFHRRSTYRPTPVFEYRVKKPSRDESCQTEQVHQDQSAFNDIGSRPKQSESSDSAPESDSSLLPACLSSHGTPLDVSKMRVEQALVKRVGKANIICLQNVSQPPLHSGAKDQSLQEHFSKRTEPTGDSGSSENQPVIEPFDICLPKNRPFVVLKSTLFDINRGKRNEIKHASEKQGKILEPGMVLLKGFLSIDDQVRIVNKCRNLGLGPGGFYQPGYRGGAKLRLKMMCLGRNWDPDTSSYEELRSIDGAAAPIIPDEFCELVKKAMKDSIALSQRNNKATSAEDILPGMTPDICVVNFYSTSGRLGLHQDKDESEGSLRKGLPVVSFSIGDAGEFLYGDTRDEKDAKKVLLESGDVLIFGGKSRHIFHGVRSVHINTAPKSLLEESDLRAGRLNLTFRQY
ncbi:uncharacterized protein LOC8260434 [Ricinus communis]|uniref:uncharacterized protein LOC8260434 n=1 Tax=Ricinus communis TaxID=3988 RepID=UPI00201AF429|nr:uncharacterized protein LOC8260434 [Ricinus communis]